MTADQAAVYLGLPSRDAIYQRRRRGQLRGIFLGRRTLRFRRSDLDRLLEG